MTENYPLPTRDIGIAFQTPLETMEKAMAMATARLERLGAMSVSFIEPRPPMEAHYRAIGEVPMTDGALRHVDAELGRAYYFDVRNQGRYYPSPTA